MFICLCCELVSVCTIHLQSGVLVVSCWAVSLALLRCSQGVADNHPRQIRTGRFPGRHRLRHRHKLVMKERTHLHVKLRHPQRRAGHHLPRRTTIPPPTKLMPNNLQTLHRRRTLTNLQTLHRRRTLTNPQTLSKERMLIKRLKHRIRKRRHRVRLNITKPTIEPICMSRDEPDRNNPLTPFFPDRTPPIPSSGRQWVALLCFWQPSWGCSLASSSDYSVSSDALGITWLI
jgi:hypothetical protein